MKTTTDPYAEIRENRLGLRIAARLSAGLTGLPHDVQERLRAGREQALARHRQPVIVMAPQNARHATVLGLAGGAAVLGGFGMGNGLDNDSWNWWSRVVSIAVGLALVTGIIAINVVQNDQNATEVADVDTALLTDDLPPQAYADPGFAQYLKTSPAQTAPASN